MPKVWHSDDEKALAVGLYRDGVGMRLVCETYRVGHRKLAFWLGDAGVEIRREGVGDRHSLDLDEIKVMLDEGLSRREIGRRLGVSRGVIYRRMVDLDRAAYKPNRVGI